MRQGHRLDQPWAGGLSGKRLFLLRASELVGSKLASPARGNSRSYFLALSPPKANHTQPRMKVERLQRATATCGLGNETIGLPVTPIPGGLPRARKSPGTVRSQLWPGAQFTCRERRGGPRVCARYRRGTSALSAFTKRPRVRPLVRRRTRGLPTCPHCVARTEASGASPAATNGG